MRTLFVNEPFRGLAFSPVRRPQMGTLLDDILSKVGVSEEDLNKLIDKIPTEYAGVYKQRLEECKAKGVTSAEGAACIYKLYQDIKNASDQPKTPATVPAAAPPASTFPTVPLVIGGLVIAGLVIYFTVVKK